MGELYSYKFPANGLSEFFDLDWNKFIEECTLIAEITQFFSEQLQYCLSRITHKDFELDCDILEKGFNYYGEEYHFVDYEDYYRLGYFYRKQKHPLNLYWMLSEGMVDDFFGAWVSEIEDNCKEEKFDPDRNIRIIFNMP